MKRRKMMCEKEREIQDDVKAKESSADHLGVWFFPVMCNIARQGRIQMGSCSGSGAVQQLAGRENGVLSLVSAEGKGPVDTKRPTQGTETARPVESALARALGAPSVVNKPEETDRTILLVPPASLWPCRDHYRSVWFSS